LKNKNAYVAGHEYVKVIHHKLAPQPQMNDALLRATSPWNSSQDQATADKYASTCFTAAAIYVGMIVLSGDLTSRIETYHYGLLEKLFFSHCLFLRPTSCF
jgi:hypothetical protein